MKHLFEIILELSFETGFWFFVDIISGEVTMEVLILTLINMLIVIGLFLILGIKEKESLTSYFFIGLFVGILVIFTVMTIFQIIHFIMSDLFGFSIQPNDRETKRWFALVNAIVVTLSPLVFLSKIKNRWKRLTLSLVNILFFFGCLLGGRFPLET